MCSAPVAGRAARYLRNVDRHPLASVATLVLGLRCSWQGEVWLVESRPPFRYSILRLVLGGRHDVLGHNGFDGGVTGGGDLFRVDDLEGWRRGNASEGRSPPDPANDVAASAGFQHPINRRPADLQGFRDLRGSLPSAFIARTWVASIEAGRPLPRGAGLELPSGRPLIGSNPGGRRRPPW
jgi:hypothetical protein